MTSFDIYNPVEYLPNNFSYSDPYNDQFDNLGYGSLNFYDAMGSVTILLVGILLI